MGDKKNTLFIYGDSFAVTFKNHFNTDNIWAKKYSEFKNGIIPKHYHLRLRAVLVMQPRQVTQPRHRMQSLHPLQINLMGM